MFGNASDDSKLQFNYLVHMWYTDWVRIVPGRNISIKEEDEMLGD